MYRRLLRASVVLILLFAACGDDNDSSSEGSGSGTSSSASGGGAETLTVQVDSNDVDNVPVSFLAYYPKAVTAHPGDTIDFVENFTGEPHTVTFGTLVDSGLEALKAGGSSSSDSASSSSASSSSGSDSASSGSDSASSSSASSSDSASGSEEGPATDLDKVPELLNLGPVVDANQAAAQPCFLDSGDPPESDACTDEQQKQPEFDGTYTYYNSGFLADGDTFSVQLADDLAPGTYNYFCTLHREGMTGSVTVVAADEDAQTAEEVDAAAEQELKSAQDGIASVIDGVKNGTLPPFVTEAVDGGVVAGGGSETQQEAVPVLFGPESVDISEGDTVTWTVVGPHTISFTEDEALRTFISKDTDGSVHVNGDSFAPIDSDGMPPPSSDEGSGSASGSGSGLPEPVVIDGGTFDGTGDKSSGAIFSFPPQLFQYTVTFTKAGSYNYICLIHPDMKGVVNVT